MESQEQIYTVVINGKPTGPYSLDQLTTLGVKSGTFVRKPGMDDYKEAQEFDELRALLGLIYRQTSPQYFASFDQRLLAFVIDYFLLVLAVVLLLILIYLLSEDLANTILDHPVLLALLPVLRFLYCIVSECGTKQGTAGKRLLSIRVTDLNGNRISAGKAAVRNLAKVLSVATLFLGFLYSFLNKRQQCLHDVVADTLVIKDRLI